jgi:hypothetical protein
MQAEAKEFSDDVTNFLAIIIPDQGFSLSDCSEHHFHLSLGLPISLLAPGL